MSEYNHIAIKAPNINKTTESDSVVATQINNQHELIHAITPLICLFICMTTNICNTYYMKMLPCFKVLNIKNFLKMSC